MQETLYKYMSYMSSFYSKVVLTWDSIHGKQGEKGKLFQNSSSRW